MSSPSVEISGLQQIIFESRTNIFSKQALYIYFRSTMAGKKRLVTGATGKQGGYVVEALLSSSF
jgi:hypothetical protein